MTDLSPPRGVRVSGADADEALLETLRALTDEGAEVGGGQGPGPSREILDFTVELTNLRDRIPVNPAASFDLTGCRALRVDGLRRRSARRHPLLRGGRHPLLRQPDQRAGLGTRLFQPRPGLNQIEGVIGRLKEDPETRRAAAVVWAPEDALREGPEGKRTKDFPARSG